MVVHSSQQLVYGGPSNMLDDCGNVNAGITGGEATIGASYDFGNGFTSAARYLVQLVVHSLKSLRCLCFNAAYTADTTVLQ